MYTWTLTFKFFLFNCKNKSLNLNISRNNNKQYKCLNKKRYLNLRHAKWAIVA